MDQVRFKRSRLKKIVPFIRHVDFDAFRCTINSVLQLTSCAFLLTTLVVYACLPVLQNLHGKTLMCHVGSLLLALVCLVVISWVTPDTTIEESMATVSCKFLGERGVRALNAKPVRV